MEDILRINWLGDSSNAKYRTFSPRLQAASTNCAAMLVFPVPAVPETRTVLQRKKPFPESIVSSLGIPDEILSRDEL